MQLHSEINNTNIFHTNVIVSSDWWRPSLFQHSVCLYFLSYLKMSDSSEKCPVCSPSSTNMSSLLWYKPENNRKPESENSRLVFFLMNDFSCVSVCVSACSCTSCQDCVLWAAYQSSPCQETPPAHCSTHASSCSTTSGLWTGWMTWRSPRRREDTPTSASAPVCHFISNEHARRPVM